MKGTLKLEDGREIAVELEDNHPFLNKPSKRWRADKGGHYFHLSSMGEVLLEMETNNELDFGRHLIGNYYRNKHEALKASKNAIKLQQIKDRIAGLNGEWQWTLGEEYTIIYKTANSFEPDTYGIVNVWPDSLKMRDHSVARTIILEFGDQLNAIFT